METRGCKICAAGTKPLWDEQFKISYFFCSRCQYIFIDEKEIVSPEQEIALYKQHNNTLENEGYVNMFEAFISKTILPYQERIKRVMDFGCGPGPVLAELLKRRGFEVDVYDPYFYPETIFEQRNYDLITATEVFEHLKDPLETARLLRGHLNPCGILAVMTLFHPGEASAFKKWWYRHDPTHISFFQPQTFKALADRLGFRVLMFDSKNLCVLEKADR